LAIGVALSGDWCRPQWRLVSPSVAIAAALATLASLACALALARATTGESRVRQLPGVRARARDTLLDRLDIAGRAVLR